MKSLSALMMCKLGCLNYSKKLYQVFLMATLGSMCGLSAYATGETVWIKANSIMQDVYSQIVTISTISAVVTASVALLLMNFSKNGKTVDEARAWIKRIVISWAIINGLGFIMAYLTPLFDGGKWTGA